MWSGRAVTILLCVVVGLSAPNEYDLRPLSDAKCWCNFERMASELQDLNKPDSNHAELVFSFVHILNSLNFKLTSYFTEFRQCVRYWLNSVRQCDASCSCKEGAVCCRNTALDTLDRSVLTLKDQVKQSFTAYSQISLLNDYYQAAFDVVNVYSSAFFEFLSALKTDKRKADNEKAHFSAFYERMERGKPLDFIFNLTLPSKSNATTSIVAQMAQHYRCDTTKVLPFYLNVYGVVLQFLLMRELQSELKAPNGQSSVSRFSDEIEWKQYLRLTHNMTKQAIFCSNKEMYAIRSQEIKEKDMAMRNAAIVFSCFLIALVLIVALIAFFACKSGQESNVTVREERAERSPEPQSRDFLLLKRHYETDDSV